MSSSSKLPEQTGQSTWPIGEGVSEWDFGFSKHDRPHLKQSVLSFDDGGTRGYASLLILRTLMTYIIVWERLRDEEGYETLIALSRSARPGGLHPPQALSMQQLRTINICLTSHHPAFCPEYVDLRDSRPPCEYFDFIVGSGTGG